MLKNILNLKGAQQLNKKEQQAVSGGTPDCRAWCGPTGGVWDYVNHTCICK